MKLWNNLFLSTIIFILMNVNIALSISDSKFIQEVSYNDGIIKKITKYQLEISKDLLSSVRNTSGIGSSLKFKNIDEKGNLYFYTITDRGPNINGPKNISGRQTLFFFNPQFVPYIGIIKISKDEGAQLIKTITMKKDGLNLSGLPTKDQDNEIALDINMNNLGIDPNGIDSESISFDNNHNFWVGDEYMPSIVKFDNEGNMLERLFPKNGLPDVLKYIQIDKGFESVANTPNGKIYGFIEEPLDIDGKTSHTALFTRIIEYEPETKNLKTYAYPREGLLYKNSSRNKKINDISSINNTNFITIEEIIDTNNNVINHPVSRVSIDLSTDITNMKLKDGRELEFGESYDLRNISMARVRKLFDLAEYGWPSETVEGISFVDSKTIAVINDNDYDVKSITIDGSDDKNIDHYKIYDRGQILLHNSQPTIAKINFLQDKKESRTHIWIIELEKNILDIL